MNAPVCQGSSTTDARDASSPASMVLPASLPSDTPVDCLTFAAPPVYSAPGRLPADLTDSITAIVHHTDVVPSLSLSAVRNLLASLRAIDAAPLTNRQRLAILTGRTPPPAALHDAIRTTTKLDMPPEDAATTVAAPDLIIPSSCVITLSHLGSGKYEANACAAEVFASFGIRLSPSCVLDHSFGFYQDALDGLLQNFDKPSIDPKESLAGTPSSASQEADKAV